MRAAQLVVVADVHALAAQEGVDVERGVQRLAPVEEEDRPETDRERKLLRGAGSLCRQLG